MGTNNMHLKGLEGIIALSAGSITYSWVNDATEITSLVAAVIGVFTAGLAGWFYFERALKMQKERIDNDNQNRGKRRRTSVSDGDRDSVGRDET